MNEEQPKDFTENIPYVPQPFSAEKAWGKSGEKEEKKEDRTGLYLIGIGILIVLCILALSFFVPQTQQQDTATYVDNNKLDAILRNQAVLFTTIIQDDNAIYNAILSEQQCKSFLSTCTLLSQDYNKGMQIIQCKTQGGT